MKHVLLGLLLSALSSVAMAEPTILNPTEKEERAIKKACAALLPGIQAAMPMAEAEETLLRNRMAFIEAELNKKLDGQGQLLRHTQVLGRQLYEKIMLLLSRGEYREITTAMSPIFKGIYSDMRTLRRLGKEISQVRIAENIDMARYAQLQTEYKAVSKTFGETYGIYKMVHVLLKSVSDGNGVNKQAHHVLRAMKAPTAAPAVEESPEELADRKLIFDLSTDRAVNAAKQALRIMDPKIEARMFQFMPEADRVIFVEEVETMFRHNCYAVVAKLERDFAEQEQFNKRWLQFLERVTSLYLENSKWMPERLRQAFLFLMGIAYDKVMLSRHLGKIHALVDVTQFRGLDDGKMYLAMDEASMSNQVKQLLEYVGTTDMDDLLTTYVRVSYYSENWVNLMGYVKKLAEKETASSGSTQYAFFYKQMQEAEERAHKLQPLPAAYSPGYTDRIVFAVAQVTEVAITLYAVDAWGWIQSGLRALGMI